MGGGASAEVGGVRVFKVSPGSPAAEAGLEVFFDFILDVNGTKMNPNYQQSFAEKIKESENGIAKLQVFNTRAHTTREVTVMPRQWAGNGLLGATVRFDMVDPSENQGIRVLEVFPNSPAAHAGLVPFQDYLLGTASCVFHDIDELVEVVSTSMNQRMQIYVYNSDSETVREVTLVPNIDWGGEGCIGCDIGTGLLHRIPAPRRSPGAPATGPAAPAAPAAPVSGIPPVPQALAAPGQPAPQGLPGIKPGGSWNPAAAGATQMPPGVAYPPGMAPAQAPVAMPGIPPVPGAPGVPITQPAYTPGVPGVPAAPGGAPGGMPAISPGGAWAPPAAAPAVTPEGMAQLQAQMAQLQANAGPTQTVAGVSWPPAQPHPHAGLMLPPGGAAPPTPTGTATLAVSPGGGNPEGPRAPHSTPMNASDMPGAVDLSGMDLSKFGAIPEQPTAEGAQALL